MRVAWYGYLDGLEIDMFPHEPQHDIHGDPPPLTTLGGQSAMRPLPEFTELTVDEKPTIAKAVVATTGALGVAIISALADGRVTVWEIVLGVLGAIGAGAATWAVSNKP